MDGSRALARGEFDHEIPIDGKDELAQLGTVFNETAGRLQHLYGDLRGREAKLRESERELQQLVEFAPTHVFVLSSQGAGIYASRVVLDYYGMTMDDWLAAGVPERIVHSEDIARYLTERNKGLAGDAPFELDVRRRRKDGTYRWFVSRFNPMRDEKGNIVRWYVAQSDIEEAKLAVQRAENENLALREEVDRSSMFEEIVGSSQKLLRVLSEVGRVAPTDSTVLILGETGTGKELIARAIHKQSNRARRAFIRVNCATIPASLISSELFGHEKGAFTGAFQRRLGRFEAADGGTIFLDEIGELPAETQVSMLRVLQEREFERLGSNQPISIDVRILAATNRNLKAAVAAGTFRSDLFYRLNVFPIQIPSLRERVDDVPLLVEYLIDRYGKRAGKKIRNIQKRTLDLFAAYDWPGNIRELQNIVERAVLLCDGDTFSVDESWLRQAPTTDDATATAITMRRTQAGSTPIKSAASSKMLCAPATAASQDRRELQQNWESHARRSSRKWQALESARTASSQARRTPRIQSRFNELDSTGRHNCGRRAVFLRHEAKNQADDAARDDNFQIVRVLELRDDERQHCADDKPKQYARSHGMNFTPKRADNCSRDDAFDSSSDDDLHNHRTNLRREPRRRSINRLRELPREMTPRRILFMTPPSKSADSSAEHSRRLQ